MYEFGKVLPGLRAQVEKDIIRPEPDQQKVLALVISLMERTYIRIGNSGYENKFPGTIINWRWSIAVRRMLIHRPYRLEPSDECPIADGNYRVVATNISGEGSAEAVLGFRVGVGFGA